MSLTINEPGKTKQTSSDKTGTAFIAKDHKDKTCHYCNKQGHIAPECRKKLRDKSNGIDVSKPINGKGGKQKPSKGFKGKGKPQQSKQPGTYWCDNCQVSTHSTDYCRNPPSYDSVSAKGGKGKSTSPKGKSHGRGQGWFNGNFPSDYPGSYANAAPDTRSETSSSYASWHSHAPWTQDEGDFGFMLQHNHDTNGSFSSLPEEQNLFVPRYEYEHVTHPLVGNTEFPNLFQIFIHWDPLYAPFPMTVRADMTIHDLMVPLSALLRINRTFLFLFFDYRMLQLCRRLDELPCIRHGAALQLQRWSLQQALAWSNEWRSLSPVHAQTWYWNFSTSTFQRAHPCPSRQQLRSPVVPADGHTPRDVAFVVHDTDDCIREVSPSMIPAEYPTWIPGRGQLWNVQYGPTMAFLLAYPTPAPSHITPAFVRKYTGCDLSRLPHYFPLILTYFERQRLYDSTPTEALSLDIANTHVSTYQLLTRLDHAQLVELL